MTCQVCGYHSGPLSVRHQCCPRAHTYRPPPAPTRRPTTPLEAAVYLTDLLDHQHPKGPAR